MFLELIEFDICGTYLFGDYKKNVSPALSRKLVSIKRKNCDKIAHARDYRVYSFGKLNCIFKFL